MPDHPANTVIFKSPKVFLFSYMLYQVLGTSNFDEDFLLKAPLAEKLYANFRSTKFRVTKSSISLFRYSNRNLLQYDRSENGWKFTEKLKNDIKAFQLQNPELSHKGLFFEFIRNKINEDDYKNQFGTAAQYVTNNQCLEKLYTGITSTLTRRRHSRVGRQSTVSTNIYIGANLPIPDTSIILEPCDKQIMCVPEKKLKDITRLTWQYYIAASNHLPEVKERAYDIEVYAKEFSQINSVDSEGHPPIDFIMQELSRAISNHASIHKYKLFDLSIIPAISDNIIIEEIKTEVSEILIENGEPDNYYKNENIHIAWLFFWVKYDISLWQFLKAVDLFKNSLEFQRKEVRKILVKDCLLYLIESLSDTGYITSGKLPYNFILMDECEALIEKWENEKIPSRLLKNRFQLEDIMQDIYQQFFDGANKFLQSFTQRLVAPASLSSPEIVNMVRRAILSYYHEDKLYFHHSSALLSQSWNFRILYLFIRNCTINFLGLL